MMRKLLATTATAALLMSAAPALAAGSSDQTVKPDVSITAVFPATNTMPSDMADNGYVMASKSQILASSLLGKPIYDGPGQDAETIGDVNDVLMAPDGTAKAIVVGVGGFLGMGEKDVAVDFSRVNWVDQDDDSRRLVIATTTEELKNAPTFDRSKIDSFGSKPMMDVSNMDSVGDMALPGTTNANMTPDTTVLDLSALSAERLIGTPVYDGNNDNMGEISDVILAADTNEIKAFIVDVGGFLGIGEKPVALAADSLQVAQTTDGSLSVHTRLTEEQLKAGPTYSRDAYSRNPDQVLVR